LQGLFLAPLASLRLHLLTLRLHLLASLRLELRLELRLTLLKLRLELRLHLLTLRLHLLTLRLEQRLELWLEQRLPLRLTLVCFSFPPLFAAVAQSSTLRAQSAADWGAVMETVMQWESPSTLALPTLALPTALPSL
jgi:hypothetical protein